MDLSQVANTNLIQCHPSFIIPRYSWPGDTLIATIFLSFAASDSLSVSDGANCTCPGQVITFTCAIVGEGITVWNGTAFSCSGSTDDIDLRHTDFSATGGTSKSCNDGTIEARSVGVMDDCYTSQLMVQVNPSLNNTTIRCSHDSTMGNILIDTFTLKFVYGKHKINSYTLLYNIWISCG